MIVFTTAYLVIHSLISPLSLQEFLNLKRDCNKNKDTSSQLEIAPVWCLIQSGIDKKDQLK